MNALMDPRAIPLRPYPGISQAFGDLVETMTLAVGKDSGVELSEWVSREMHAATAADIVAMVDAAVAHLVSGTPLPERGVTVRRLDLLRGEISRQVASEQVRMSRDFSDEIVEGILGIIALNDPDLHEHLDAVGVLSGRIALAMGLDADFAKVCQIVGRLHDVGKMAIPRSILYKSSPLEPDDYAIIRRHADAGHKMISGIPGLSRYAAGVRSHHERLDGSGYPDRLQGMDIPLEARIVAVADVFHAMTTSRCYRPALEPQAAVREIQAGRSILYDSSVVNAALRIVGLRQDVAPVSAVA